jgi:hypothetical protein
VGFFWDIYISPTSLDALLRSIPTQIRYSVLPLYLYSSLRNLLTTLFSPVKALTGGPKPYRWTHPHFSLSPVLPKSDRDGVLGEQAAHYLALKAAGPSPSTTRRAWLRRFSVVRCVGGTQACAARACLRCVAARAGLRCARRGCVSGEQPTASPTCDAGSSPACAALAGPRHARRGRVRGVRRRGCVFGMGDASRSPAPRPAAYPAPLDAVTPALHRAQKTLYVICFGPAIDVLMPLLHSQILAYQFIGVVQNLDVVDAYLCNQFWSYEKDDNLSMELWCQEYMTAYLHVQVRRRMAHLKQVGGTCIGIWWARTKCETDVCVRLARTCIIHLTITNLFHVNISIFRNNY